LILLPYCRRIRLLHKVFNFLEIKIVSNLNVPMRRLADCSNSTAA
jgi:hypothetical protein